MKNTYEEGMIKLKGLKISWRFLDNVIPKNWDSKQEIEQFRIKIQNGDKKESFDFYNSIMEKEISDKLKENKKGYYQNWRQLFLFIRPKMWGGYDDAKKNYQTFVKKRIWWLLSSALNSIMRDGFKFSEYSGSSFDWFCDNFGYDKDSRKAEKIFKACQEMEEQLKNLDFNKEQSIYIENQIMQKTDLFNKHLAVAIEIAEEKE